MKRRVLIGVIILSSIMSFYVGVRVQADDIAYTYIRDNLTIVSYSETWSTEESLSALADELYSNRTGEELALLSYIYIRPESREGASALYYNNLSMQYDKVTMNPGGYIELYNGDEITTVKEYARMLAHEYGHHFMAYYMAKEENLMPMDWQESRYAKVRGLSELTKVTYIGEHEDHYNHEWDIVEILAEDYVQLYGSPLAKTTTKYLDVEERLAKGISEYYYDYDSYNLLPQENLELTLITDSQESIDYMVELTRLSLDNEPIILELSKPRFEYIESIYREYNQYRFSWEEEASVRNYTLIIYEINDNDYPIPLGSKTSYEVLEVDSGTAIDLNQGVGIFQEFEGHYGLRVLAEDIHGFIHSSDETEITITRSMNKPRMFTDLSDQHWAYDDIMYCSMRDVFQGYEDLSFQPDNSMSRDEFITTVLRGVKNIEFGKVDSSYWFESDGYMGQANALKLNLGNWSVEELKQPILREEMAELILRGLELNHSINRTEYIEIDNESVLTDVEESQYNESIYLMEHLGIINGYTDFTYRPKAMASRSEVAKLLRFFLILSEDD